MWKTKGKFFPIGTDALGPTLKLLPKRLKNAGSEAHIVNLQRKTVMHTAKIQRNILEISGNLLSPVFKITFLVIELAVQ